MTEQNDAIERWLPWIPVGLAVIVQVHVVGNAFMYDDFIHLFKMANGPFSHAVLAPHGGHWLLCFNTVVWLLHRCFGLNPGAFYFFALVAHAAGVRLSFAIIANMTRRPHLAAFGAALWGMSPFLPGSIGWMSVHGHVYATTAILGAVYLVDRARTRETSVPRLLVGCGTLLLVAASSFGVGLAAAMGFFAVVFVWNPLPRYRTRLTVAFGLLTVTIAVLYVATTLLYSGSMTNPVEVIDLQAYLLGLPAKFVKVSAFGIGGLLLGPALVGDVHVVADRHVLDASYAAGLVFAAAVAYGLVASRPDARRRIVALVLLVCLCYAPISATRWIGLSSLREQPRYHDLSLAILSIVLCLALSSIAVRQAATFRRGRLLFFLWAAVAFVPYAMASQSQSGMRLEQVAKLTQARLFLRAMLNANAENSEAFLPNVPYTIGPRIFFAPKEFPGLAAVYIISYPENSVDGTRVYFLSDPADREMLLEEYEGSRLSELLR